MIRHGLLTRAVTARPALLTAGTQAAQMERERVLKRCWPEQGLTMP